MVQTVARDIAIMGHMKVIRKTDNEPRAKDMMSHPTIVEESPEYEPQANVIARACVQTIKGLSATASSALDHCIGERIPDWHVVMLWLIRHVASLRNRYHVGTDGRAPWERVTGRRSERPSADFGERGPGAGEEVVIRSVVGICDEPQYVQLGTKESKV